MLDYVPLSLGSLDRLGRKGGYWYVSWAVPRVTWDIPALFFPITLALCGFFTLVASAQWSHSADCTERPSFVSESKVRISSYPLPSRDLVRFVNFDILRGCLLVAFGICPLK